jgi:hypothetical protein
LTDRLDRDPVVAREGVERVAASSAVIDERVLVLGLLVAAALRLLRVLRVLGVVALGDVLALAALLRGRRRRLGEVRLGEAAPSPARTG